MPNGWIAATIGVVIVPGQSQAIFTSVYVLKISYENSNDQPWRRHSPQFITARPKIGRRLDVFCQQEITG